MQTLNKMSTKLEKEAASHIEAKQQVEQLTARLNEFQQMVSIWPYCSKKNKDSINLINIK